MRPSDEVGSEPHRLRPQALRLRPVVISPYLPHISPISPPYLPHISRRLSVFDLSSLPHAIVHVGTCRDAAYAQCVGQGTHSAAPTPPPLLYAALWASPGGVGVFRLDTGGAPVEVARHVSPLCAKSNRVVLLASGSGRARALLPLESFPGGVALVDVGAGEASLSAPPSADGSQECELLGRRMFTGPKDTCYCAAAVSSSHVYAFAAHACTMHVLRMRATGVSDPKPL